MTVLSWSRPINWRVLYIGGPLRTPMDRTVRHLVKALLHQGERHIVLDLMRVSQIDAAGIGELVRAYNMARALNGTVRVVNPNAWVRHILERVGLDGFLFPHGFARISEVGVGRQIIVFETRGSTDRETNRRTDQSA